MVAAVFGLLALRIDQASAQAQPCDTWYGRTCWMGYFANQTETAGTDVIIGGMPSIVSDDKAGFIATVLGHLNSGDPQRVTGAQFIILTMLGNSGGVAKTVTPEQLQQWQDRVNNPSVQMLLTTVLFDCGISNSYYQPTFNDVAAAASNPLDGCGQINEMIDFIYNGVVVYRIRAACANPLGNLPGLPAVPSTNTQCGAITLRPQRPEVNDAIVVTPIIRYSGGPIPPVLSAYSIAVTNSAGNPGTVTSTATASNGVVKMTSSSFRVPTAGQYTVRWSATVNGKTVNCGGRFAPGDSFIAMSYPFLRVNGGDTTAGVSFSAPSGTSVVPCSSAAHNIEAGVVSSNRNTAPNYSGAGGSYAVYAMNYIQSFAPDQGKGRGATSLSFSNVDYPDDGANSIQADIGRFGGLFGSAPCIDYWGAKPADSQLTPLAASASLNSLSGKYRYTGNLTIGNSLIQDRSKLTIYVKGDVSINGDIVYQGNDTSWVDTVDIPNFRLIVSGRIFISSTVSQLDGLYVAIPDADYITATSSFTTPAKGTISTCSTGFTSINPLLAASNGMVATCSRRLTVNGSFVANQMFLLRTFGTVSSNEPAEVFNYTPELWLAPTDAATVGSYDTMTGLPPIL